MRLLKGTDYLLASPAFVGADQETPTATTGTPVCTVTRADGTVLTAPTVAAISPASAGVYTALLTAAVHTSTLDCLSIVWTGTAGGMAQTYTDVVDVVGAHYVTVPQMRAYPDLGSPAKYPTQMLRDIRDEYETLIEQVCGIGFVPRYQRDVLFGTGTQQIQLSQQRPSRIQSITVDGTAVLTSLVDFTLSGRLIYQANIWRQSYTGLRNVIVNYEHGYTKPPPKLVREILKAIRMEAVSQQSTVQSNAISQTFDGMTIRFSTPNPKEGRPTGILTLDPVLIEYSERLPVIG